MRIVVLGGYGNFGARICRALSADAGCEVIAAGRDPSAGIRQAGLGDGVGSARLDLASRSFPLDLASLAPTLVVHCAGPFQGQDYTVARAALAARCHYIDLADSRAFVAGFASALDADARAAGVLAVSGASSVPALSSAVVDALGQGFQALRAIHIVIAPAQRAPRGAATLSGVFSYAGRPVRVWRGGAWVETHGWQDLARVRVATMPARWAAVCDVPDLELFPARYPGVETVEFRAALELGIQHFALWLAAALRRGGVSLPIERWAPALDRLASMLDRFGTERGGMLVSLSGPGRDGTPRRVDWHLCAGGNHGPEIPCMAAILLARKLTQGRVHARGAYPCMGFLSLAEFVPEFARWGMTASTEERAP
jgi:saccharopine dehydrogenase-like NADP-dependent oxidoreductase